MTNNSPQQPGTAALPGFEEIPRVWDAHHSIWLARIQPGELCVTTSREAVTTVLGSCIAACIRDIRTGIGGMNHFMLLPGTGSGADDGARHAVDAMTRLADAVLAHGCGERSRLELKLVGACSLKPGTQDVGRDTVEFARRFAAAAKLTVVAEDVGGMLGREVIYWPGTGQLRIRKLRGIQALVAEREREYERAIASSLQAVEAGTRRAE